MEINGLITACTVVLCLSSVSFGIEVQSVSEAREAILQRYARQATTEAPGQNARGDGVFGNDTLIFHTSCIKMEAKGARVAVQQSESPRPFFEEDLMNATDITVTGGDCTGDNVNGTELTMTFKSFGSGAALDEAVVNFLFRQDNFFWWIQNITMDLTYANGNGTESFDLDALGTNAGRGNAYLCQDQYGFATRFTDGIKLGRLNFDELLIRAFTNDTSGNFTYGMVEPCEYAFTLPLWMATVTGLIMALILALGITMLANIKTPDRFDDPKTSKLLSVPNE